MSLARAENSQRFPNNLPEGWYSVLAGESEKPYFQTLVQFLKDETKRGHMIFPPQDKILSALQAVDYSDVRVVILGQDPYHGPGQAMGHCFAVPNALSPKPPSLINIFKEIESDCGKPVDKSQSELRDWMRHGVLLLNSVLTVRAREAYSHRDKGWELFTDAIMKALNERDDPIIFLLWGSPAQAKAHWINPSKHFVFRAPHPSPLSAHRGFFGCKHFSAANRILKDKLGRQEIPWWNCG